jgi:hypothetical protein
MAELTDVGLFTPLMQELAVLYGKYMPEEDVLDIKIMIRKYFKDKYHKKEELVLAEIGSVREDFGEWVHDPGK